MTRLSAVLLMTSSLVTANPSTAQDQLSYPPQAPAAKKVPKVTTTHGDTLHDDYFWLREKTNPEVRAYVEAENTYADALMSHTKQLQETLYREMVGHIKEDDLSAPYRDGDWFYYARTEKGKQYPIFLRKKAKSDGSVDRGANEQLVIDQNELAKGEKFMAIGAQVRSNDGNWLAYSTDNTGFRQYTLYVKDLRDGKLSTEKVPRVTTVAWANDNKTLFYTVEDEQTKRSYRLYRHTVGEDHARDTLVYEEKDESMSLGVDKTRSRSFLLLEDASLTTSEVRYLDADKPSGEWKLIAPRIPGQEYYVDHRGDEFLVRSNHNARTFELLSAPAGAPDRKNWRPLAPARQDVMLENVDAFADYAVLLERANGLRQLRVIDFKKGRQFTGKEDMVSFPEPAYNVIPEKNFVFDTEKLRYNYESPITPSSVYEYDMQKKASTLIKQTEVPGGFDRNNYELERIFATAKDGVKVPVTVFYRKGLKRDGSAPLFLYSYGSYGYPLPLNFSANRLSFLDRGLVVALAHIRGGGDLGKPWHDDGRMKKKMNTFTDFIASAEHLVAQKYAHPERIAINGGSAGGLLMGAVTNLRPGLWKAVVSKVPFVDVMNTMLDASLPLTVGEYEEWGNPNKKDEYFYMKQYSPYDNLKPVKYPAMLITTSFNDSQVMYWEPAKYVAKLRTLKPKDDANPLLLKTNMAAGHGGASGRYDYLREVAYDYAFILWQLGLAEKPGDAVSTAGTNK